MSAFQRTVAVLLLVSLSSAQHYDCSYAQLVIGNNFKLGPFALSLSEKGEIGADLLKDVVSKIADDVDKAPVEDKVTIVVRALLTYMKRNGDTRRQIERLDIPLWGTVAELIDACGHRKDLEHHIEKYEAESPAYLYSVGNRQEPDKWTLEYTVLNRKGVCTDRPKSLSPEPKPTPIGVFRFPDGDFGQNLNAYNRRCRPNGVKHFRFLDRWRSTSSGNSVLLTERPKKGEFPIKLSAFYKEFKNEGPIAIVGIEEGCGTEVPIYTVYHTNLKIWYYIRDKALYSKLKGSLPFPVWDPTMDMAIQAEIGLFMLLGLSTPLINAPVLAAIFSSALLRVQKEFVIIAGLSLSDAFNGFVFALVAVYRWIVLAGGKETVPTSRWHCLTTVPQMCSIVSDLAFGWMLLVVTFDRFFAVFAPIRYFKTEHSYAWKMLGAVLLQSFLCLFVALIFTRHDTLPEVGPYCYTDDSVDKKVGFAFAIIRIVTVACSIFLYLPICLRLYMIAKQKRLGRYSTRRYTQLKNMTLTVALSSASGIAFVLLPDTVSAFDIFGLKKYSSYFFVLLFAKSISTVSIYFFRSPALSERMKRLVWRKKETRILLSLSTIVTSKRKLSSTLSMNQNS
ncbi:hypothetical protein QR680_004820 [Steinernema hermaphroditum]|uniref:G-protein coupled receptors family 1 profile domain-containing protein n=1 Tax=Steinernema hermaphroditum TaxID=289476 RepID=A0AA39HR45_9BILA|nr:hypothetical protein QR680_004820 [Steinernema hermaphroditum]